MIENISKIKFRNGTPKLIQDSTFQGHISDATSVEDIAPSLQVMFMDICGHELPITPMLTGFFQMVKSQSIIRIMGSGLQGGEF